MIHDEMQETPSFLSTGPFPILSLNRLSHLLGVPRVALDEVCASADDLYRPYYQVKKKANGTIKRRKIDNPKPRIKAIQRKVHQRLLAEIELPDTIVAGIKGRSPSNHARFHVQQPVVVAIDIKDCYPNTDHVRVFRVFREALDCSNEVARVLTRLTTYKGYLPQGAPTSPMVCNLCLLPIHDGVRQIAEELDLRYSI